MKRPVPLLLLLASLCVVGGCSSTEALNGYYEGDDLVMVRHNDYNDYMVLVYRDVLGQTRHVVRRGGICEMVITYEMDGDVELKARGRKTRKLDAHEVSLVTQQVNSLLTAGGKPKGQWSSTE